MTSDFLVWEDNGIHKMEIKMKEMVCVHECVCVVCWGVVEKMDWTLK